MSIQGMEHEREVLTKEIRFGHYGVHIFEGDSVLYMHDSGYKTEYSLLWLHTKYIQG